MLRNDTGSSSLFTAFVGKERRQRTRGRQWSSAVPARSVQAAAPWNADSGARTFLEITRAGEPGLDYAEEERGAIMNVGARKPGERTATAAS